MRKTLLKYDLYKGWLHIEHDMRKIKTEQKALEKKKDAYVVFDFK